MKPALLKLMKSISQFTKKEKENKQPETEQTNSKLG
jgi:hypothetical protein